MDASPGHATTEPLDFDDRLYARMPRPWVTWALLAVSVAAFAAMVAAGHNGLWADAPALVAWGANFGPLTLGGQWWRLLTAAFLHGGALHIALNAVMLLDGGPVLERAVGHLHFLAIYLLTAIVAGLASVAVHPSVVSVGASGAIFGVFGALLGLALRHAPPGHRWRHLVESVRARGRAVDDAHAAELHDVTIGDLAMPPHVTRRLLGGIVVLFLFNLAVGLAMPAIDNSAHVGGFALGILLGWGGAGALATRLEVPRKAGGRGRVTMSAAAAAVLVVGGSAAFPFAPPGVRQVVYRAGCTMGVAPGCLAAAATLASTSRVAAAPALPLLARACELGSAEGCARLGAAYLAGGPAGFAPGIQALTRACDAGAARSCTAAGIALDTAKGLARDFPRALRFYERGCRAGDAAGCFALGEVHRIGRGVPVDAGRARTLHLRACTRGERRACGVACTLGAEQACQGRVTRSAPDGGR